MAFEHFGAVWGEGVGLFGQSYAIPTMQGGVETIKPYVDDFLQFARTHQELDFLVTEIGCGIAGFTPREIAPLFFEAIENDIRNVYLPESFYALWKGDFLVESYYKVCECGTLYPYTEAVCPICGSDTIKSNLSKNQSCNYKAVEVVIGKTEIDNPYDADVPDERGIKRCLNGHYYKGEGCPHCEKEHYPVYLMDKERNPVYYHGITKGHIPICPHCGKPVRKETPKPNWPIVGSVKSAYDRNVPWNYQWDGTCENCGRNLGLWIFQTIPNSNPRFTYVREASKQVKTSLDSMAGLSGVEIVQNHGSETDTNQCMFISTNELKCLINALQNSPLLEQLDWGEDYT